MLVSYNSVIDFLYLNNFVFIEAKIMTHRKDSIDVLAKGAKWGAFIGGLAGAKPLGAVIGIAAAALQEGAKSFSDERTKEIKHDIDAGNVLPAPSCRM